jgi:hypothetical protein
VNTYGIALFVQIVGLIALFSALVLLQRGVVRLRQPPRGKKPEFGSA